MKRIITESIYDEQGRVIKITTTEEDYNDLAYAPYTLPYNPLQGPYPTPYAPSVYTTSASQTSQSAVMSRAEGYFA